MKASTVEHHALERYRIHHPEADATDVLVAVEEAIPLNTALARTMVGRAVDNKRWKNNESYHLAADRRGIFVVHDRGSVITYLRFGHEQEQFARKNWPITAAPQKPDEPFVPAPVRPNTKAERARFMRSMSVAELIEVARRPHGPGRDYSEWPHPEAAVTELFARRIKMGNQEVVLPGVTFIGTYLDSFGTAAKAKLALCEATFEPQPMGRTRVTFANGRGGVLVECGDSHWTLLMDY